MSYGIIAAGWTLGEDRIDLGRRDKRAVARPDEDALTLAVEAASRALNHSAEDPTTIIFASTTAPYDQGGSAQILAEFLGLDGSTFTLELTSTERDGLAALNIALAIAERDNSLVLVCAGHADREHAASGAGAVALLVGPGDPIATIETFASHTEELRDRWRLRGTDTIRNADRSFVETIGTERLAEVTLAARALPVEYLPLVTGTDQRAANRIEKKLGGSGDPLSETLGSLGAAHALARLLAGLDRQSCVLAIGGGMADALLVEPGHGAAEVAAEFMRDVTLGGRAADEIMAPKEQPEDFRPFVSIARAWRERGLDLRLEGILTTNDDGTARVPAREVVTGIVVTWVRDHVYPASRVTDTAVIDVDSGGRFFGQVAAGDQIAIGDRVRLVPRRLFEGDGTIQYFWKVASCR